MAEDPRPLTDYRPAFLVHGTGAADRPYVDSTGRPARLVALWHRTRDAASDARRDFEEPQTADADAEEVSRRTLREAWRKLDTIRRKRRHKIARRFGFDVRRRAEVRPLTQLSELDYARLYEQIGIYDLLRIAQGVWNQTATFALTQGYSPSRTLALVKWRVNDAILQTFLAMVANATRIYGEYANDQERAKRTLAEVATEVAYAGISLQTNKRLYWKLRRWCGNAHHGLTLHLFDAAGAVLDRSTLPEDFRQFHTRVARHIERLADNGIKDQYSEAPADYLQELGGDVNLSTWEYQRESGVLTAPHGESMNGINTYLTHADPTADAVLYDLTLKSFRQLLANRERRVFDLHVIHGLTYQATADRMGIKIGTIGPTITRIKEKYRKFREGM